MFRLVPNSFLRIDLLTEDIRKLEIICFRSRRCVNVVVLDNGDGWVVVIVKNKHFLIDLIS